MAISDMPWALPAKQPIHTAQEMKEAAATLIKCEFPGPEGMSAARLLGAIPVAPTDDARKLALAREALEKAACDCGIECMAEDQPMSKCPHYVCQCALAAIERA